MEPQRMTINREIRNYLLNTNLYPTKDDLEIWRHEFCQDYDIEEDAVSGIVSCAYVHDIRKKAHVQILEYLHSDDAASRAPNLQVIAQEIYEAPPTNRA